MLTDPYRAVQYRRDRSFAVVDEVRRAPEPGSVEIEVGFVGLCGTDLHIFHGSMDGRVAHDAVIGHEMSGTIAAIGDGVDGWSVGDRVTVMPLDWDGTCQACLAGNEHICQNLDFIGIDSPGALQQYWNVPARTLVRLPDGLSLDHAALVEPVAVSVHDVRRSGLVPGERAVVIGGGPIGVLIATTAREFGAEVVVVELDATRRAAVAELGFEVLDPRAVDQVAWVDEWTRGAGADVVFEVSGAAAAVLGATSLARVRGRVVVVAIHTEPRPIDLQRVFWRELTLIGARVYERADFETAVELLARGVVPADLLITRIEPLAAVQDAFAELDAGRAMKILIDVGGAPSAEGAR
ncbi:2-desacetyl-2-hydroxyethyl bacteriochlorophyllide A dehydrogenase [Rathayibacter oskolensis]|uniref:2-desacetyl-2-hydroxyethyl bacteriochlorophyllide A dehydrogenase n=1 Tax=Rathayibacter oskolensis TaxID=1891671 RepID=A0A1X7MVZ0_9MICO|nr:alcohol dehydrogenase catalytic domain-containing protein [Rathayibacter oskolensis]SMH28566.1 2-desacetyl-2-hydroxyethyl bacteriochlorophyllide A dehydrogenase [Rathayibacter oskolensis]